MVRNHAGKTKVNIITRSGAREEIQPRETNIAQNSNMAVGSYIIPTMDWTHDSQLPDRLEDFKRECVTLFGLELKDADDNSKALRVIQWAGELGTRQFKVWNIKTEDLRIKTVWERFEEFAAPTKNFMRARFDLSKDEDATKREVNLLMYGTSEYNSDTPGQL